MVFAIGLGGGPLTELTARAQGTGLQQQWEDYRRAQSAYAAAAEALRRGNTAEAQAAYLLAASHYRRVLAQSPGRGEVYGLLGDALVSGGRLAEALVVLGQQVKQGNRDPQVRWALCRALHGLRQGPRALQEAQEVLAAQPEHPEALKAAAQLALELRRDDAALPLLQRVFKGPATGAAQIPLSAAEEYDLRLGYTQVLLRSGRSGDAVAALAQLSQRQPEDPALRRAHAAAVAQAEEERRQQADALLRKGVQLLADPTPSRDALATLQRAYALQPGPEAARALAVAQLLSGAAADAVATLRPHRADAPALLLLGRALREAGQLEESGAQLRQALQTRLPPALSRAAAQELALTLLEAHKPVEACGLLRARGGPGAGAEVERLTALSCLRAAREGSADALSAAQQLRARLGAEEAVELELLLAQSQARAAAPGSPVQADAALHRVQALESGQRALVQQLYGPNGLGEWVVRLAVRANQLPLAVQRAAALQASLPRDRAQALQRHFVAAYIAKANYAYERHDYDRAYQMLKGLPSWAEPPRSEPMSRDAGVFYYDLAMIQLARGHTDEAQALLGKLNPKDLSERWLGLGACLDAQGNRRGALEHYRHYLQAQPPLPGPPRPTVELARRWVETIQRQLPAGDVGTAALELKADGKPDGRFDGRPDGKPDGKIDGRGRRGRIRVVRREGP